MKEEEKHQHIDEFVEFGSMSGQSINDDEAETYARWVFLHFRLPAVMKIAFDEYTKDLKLFCMYEGKKYRVTGASRLGDVWLTKDFNQDTGYQARVMVDQCNQWTAD